MLELIYVFHRCLNCQKVTRRKDRDLVEGLLTDMERDNVTFPERYWSYCLQCNLLQTHFLNKYNEYLEFLKIRRTKQYRINRLKERLKRLKQIDAPQFIIQDMEAKLKRPYFQEKKSNI